MDKKKRIAEQKIFAYWEGFTDSGSTADKAPPLGATPAYVDIVAIAFSVPGQNNTIDTSFVTSKNNSQQAIIADTLTLKKRGQKVVMSINGNDNVPWGSLDPIPFANAVSELASTWHLDGIDLDNETWGTTPGDEFVKLIRAIRDKMGKDFLITYPAYQTFRDDFLKQAHPDLSYVFTMAYWQEYEDAVNMFKHYEGLLDGPEKLMIGIKPGVYGEDQSTPEADAKRLVSYKPDSGDKAGMMFYSLSLDIEPTTDKKRFSWVSMVNDGLNEP